MRAILFIIILALAGTALYLFFQDGGTYEKIQMHNKQIEEAQKLLPSQNNKN